MKKFMIDQFQIEISAEAQSYNSFRKRYQEKAKLISNKFDNEFNVLFDDMDELHEKCPKIAQQYLLDTVDMAIRDIIEAGITEVSDEIFISQYVTPRITWKEDFLIIDDQYMEIALGSEAYDDYKKSRSSGGGPIMGGGFGAEGAAAGIAIATAANLAIGAIGGILNAASDGLNSLGEKQLKEDIFNDPNTRVHLVKSIYDLVFQIHMAVIDAIVDIKGNINYEIISKTCQAKSNAIIENIKKERIQSSEIKKALIDALKLDPYNDQAYRYWFKVYGDSDKKLLTVANYFGIQNLYPLKDLSHIALKTKNNNSSENKVIEASKNKVTGSDNNTSEDKDEGYIFDGKAFNTKEEANEIRIRYIEKFLNSEKKLDAGKKEEFEKIYKSDVRVQNVTSTGAVILIVCILIMILHTPWWHGLVLLLVLMIPFMPYESYVKKRALKEWLNENLK